jgi:hypothetical protein
MKLKQLFCKHDFVCDKQIPRLICQKCGESHWIRFGNVYRQTDFYFNPKEWNKITDKKLKETKTRQ